ncbi:MAG: hypothetical protein ACRCWW_14360 [Scandinavium sp.]|uniref:hypothetical protein n=1 Tax=Scandinavium sp. TaxID=2830653 RepID=UPI003F3A526F
MEDKYCLGGVDLELSVYRDILEIVAPAVIRVVESSIAGGDGDEQVKQKAKLACTAVVQALSGVAVDIKTKGTPPIS